MIMMAISLLVWIAAIGCGVMAGVYFAFSAFIMMAFARIDEAHARVAAGNPVRDSATGIGANRHCRKRAARREHAQGTQGPGFAKSFHG